MANGSIPTAKDRPVSHRRRQSWFSWRSLTLRLVFATAIWIVVLLGAGGTLIAGVFERYIVQNFDARLTQFLESMIGASEIAEDGQVRLTRLLGDQRFLEPYSGWYWQVDTPGRPSFRSPSLWDQALTVDLARPAFDERIELRQGPDNQMLRVAERDIYLPDSNAIFRYAVAGDVSELDEQIAQFRYILGWSLGVLGFGLIVALLLQVSFGLRPLRVIRRELAKIRAGQERRLEGQYPVEIQPLAYELNALIDHNAEVVDRARTHAGNLAHALKTPLSVLMNAASHEDSELASTVSRQTQEMRRHIDHHLARARATGGSRTLGARTPVGQVAAGLIRALERINADRGIDFQLLGDENLAFRGAKQDLEEMLGNLMDNAAKWAKSAVCVSISRSPIGQVPLRLYIAVEDDGPGIPASERSHVFDRGRRADEKVPGSGLGLAIVRDMAELCGGRVELGDSKKLGGLHALLDLPLAE